MRIVVVALLSALVVGLVPGSLPVQAQQAERAAKAVKPSRSGFALETGEACSGISVAECCEQKIEMAGLRTQGDYLPRLIKTTVQLACENADRVVTPQVCRSIATSRGFAPKEVDAVCKPAARECKKDQACRQCVDDLAHLNYSGSHHACQAVTYIKDQSAKVVVLRNGGAADSDTRFEVTRRRVQLH
jgi:hypothetical protein